MLRQSGASALLLAGREVAPSLAKSLAIDGWVIDDAQSLLIALEQSRAKPSA